MKHHRHIVGGLFAAIFTLISTSSYADDEAKERCRTVNWKPGDIIVLEAEQYKHTHITLPEEALDVVWGTQDLWEQSFIKNNVFLRPLTHQPQGKETTATVIGNSGNSYQFVVKRVAKMKSHCAIVNTNGGLIHRANWDNKEALAQAQVQLLQQQLVKANIEKAQAVQEGQRQAKEAVKAYRSAIYAKYDWSQAEGWFASSGIESVQDDGRFTYIRLKSDNRGIMAVVAEIDGKQEILESVYDASKREYRVAGIYPKFKLRAGNSETTVTRGS